MFKKNCLENNIYVEPIAPGGRRLQIIFSADVVKLVPARVLIDINIMKRFREKI
jgi:hypothetical protein